MNEKEYEFLDPKLKQMLDQAVADTLLLDQVIESLQEIQSNLS